MKTKFIKKLGIKIAETFKKVWKKVIIITKIIITKPTVISTISSILAIVFGLFIGFLIMLFVNPNYAVNGIITITTSGFESLSRLGDSLYYAIPIILTGLSVAFAFRTGLFNIGATGQLTFGAFFGVYVGVHWGFLGPAHWIVALLVSMIAGAVWGAIPGILKAYRNVHEVVSSIMMNYIAMYFMIAMSKRFIPGPYGDKSSSPASTAIIPRMGLDTLFNSRYIHSGIFIVILVVIILHILLNKTIIGYELKATGFNKDASKYSGMNEKRNIILAMTISGAVAGLAGGLKFLSHIERGIPLVADLFSEGFTGIAISLLGLNAPIGVFFAGLFYGGLERGAFFVSTRFDVQIVQVIIAVIIYFSALALFLRQYISLYIQKRKNINKDTDPKGDDA